MCGSTILLIYIMSGSSANFEGVDAILGSWRLASCPKDVQSSMMCYVATSLLRKVATPSPGRSSHRLPSHGRFVDRPGTRRFIVVFYNFLTGMDG